MAVTAAQVKELRERTGVGMMDAKKALVEVDGDMDKAIDLLREKGMAKAAKKADRITAEGLTGIFAAGNVAALVEINSETDFVAKNDQFKNIVANIAKLVAKNKPKDLEQALALTNDKGATIKAELVEGTQIIGEKLNFRRFKLVEKADSENFGIYSHMGGRIGVLTVINGGDELAAKDVAMHVAAIDPQYISRGCVPDDVVKHERSILLNSDDMKSKPENVQEKIVEGRLNKFLAEISLEDQPFVKNPDETVAKFLSGKGAAIKSFIRFEVGEGIEKKEEDFASEVMAQAKLK
ncbi:MAG: translation elongation factor Ts [Lactobacillales bacterium]|jgi:elongation factor Ts|nr:translation elongation factor Ts [Lactobacillales bacterium]